MPPRAHPIDGSTEKRNEPNSSQDPWNQGLAGESTRQLHASAIKRQNKPDSTQAFGTKGLAVKMGLQPHHSASEHETNPISPTPTAQTDQQLTAQRRNHKTNPIPPKPMASTPRGAPPGLLDPTATMPSVTRHPLHPIPCPLNSAARVGDGLVRQAPPQRGQSMTASGPRSPCRILLHEDHRFFKILYPLSSTTYISCRPTARAGGPYTRGDDPLHNTPTRWCKGCIDSRRSRYGCLEHSTLR